MRVKRVLLLFIAVMAAATVLQSCSHKKDSLSGTQWRATEHEELRGGTINTSIEFLSDSTGNYCLVSWDLGDGLTEENIVYPFNYTYDESSQDGKIFLKGDENVYPFSLNDTALLFPGITWKLIPYKQVK